MNGRENPEAALREAIFERRAVLVTGTGTSVCATFDPLSRQSHPQASWSGLLKHGLAWLQEHELIEPQRGQAHFLLLNGKKPQTHHFLSAAQDIVEGFGGTRSTHFRKWLVETVGTVKATDHSVLDAVHALREHGNLLATTNYDGLLLSGAPTLFPVTWRDGATLVTAVRERDNSKVIFLHGYWREPESVILDWDSYYLISSSDTYREDLKAFWQLHTWVYIGRGTWRPRKCFTLESTVQTNTARTTALPTRISISDSVYPRVAATVTVSMTNLCDTGS